MGERRILNLTGKRLIGLDIDSSSVRAIQLRRKNGQYVVTGAAVSDVAPWDDDPELHRTNTVQAIRHCTETLGSNGKLAVCGLRGPEVVVRGFEFPVLPPDEINDAVSLEASQICPFTTDESVLDHQVTSSNDKKTQGFWVAATESLIRSKRQLAHDAGLKCALVDLDGLAMLNCLENLPSEAAQTTGGDEGNGPDITRPAVLSIGDAYTSMAIVDHARRPFVRDLCSGGQDIVNRIVRETRLAPEIVRTALYEDASTERENVRRGLEKACAPLLDDIATTLRYYIAQNRFTHISRVLVCGNLARAESFVTLLSTKLSIDAIAWNPVAHLRCEADSQCETVLHEAGPTVAVAAGLAMRTI